MFSGRKIGSLASQPTVGGDVTGLPRSDDFAKIMKATGATAQQVVGMLMREDILKGANSMMIVHQSSHFSTRHRASSTSGSIERIGQDGTQDCDRHCIRKATTLAESLLKIAGVNFHPHPVFEGASETFSGSDKGRDFILERSRNWTITVSRVRWTPSAMRSFQWG